MISVEELHLPYHLSSVLNCISNENSIIKITSWINFILCSDRSWFTFTSEYPSLPRNNHRTPSFPRSRLPSNKRNQNFLDNNLKIYITQGCPSSFLNSRKPQGKSPGFLLEMPPTSQAGVRKQTSKPNKKFFFQNKFFKSIFYFYKHPQPSS